MSYTIDIKNEIALSNEKCTNMEIIAELSGFIRNNANIKKDNILLTTENKNIADRIISFVKRIYDILFSPTAFYHPKVIHTLEESELFMYGSAPWVMLP